MLVRAAVDECEMEMTEQEKDCIKSLWFPNLEARLYDIVDANPDTCQWLEEHDKYRKAFSEHGPRFLSISGKPGCGKSVLTKYVFNDLRTLLKTASEDEFDEAFPISSRACAYFAFNSRGDPEDNTPKAFLRSVLFQLFTSSYLIRRTPIPEIYQLLRSSSKTKDTTIDWPLHILKEIFSALAASPQPILSFVFLDALDEAPQLTAIECLSLLREYNRKPSDSAAHRLSCKNVMLTSRPETLVRLCDETYTEIPRIHLEGKDMKNTLHDVETYVLQERNRIIKHRQKELYPLTRQIVKQSNGIFLWVKIVMHEIIQQAKSHTFQELQNLIEEIPSDMENLYRLMLQKCHKTNRKERQRMLEWALISKRPLTLSEFRTAIAIQGKDATVQSNMVGEESNTAELEHRIHRFSGGLLQIGPQIDSRGKEGKVVQLIHQTAKEFLIHNPADWTCESVAQLDVFQCVLSSRLASDCLRYIAMDGLVEFLDKELYIESSDDGSEDDSEDGLEASPERSGSPKRTWYDYSERKAAFLRCFESYPFLPYAVEAWPFYAEQAGEYFPEIWLDFETMAFRNHLQVYTKIADHLKLPWIRMGGLGIPDSPLMIAISLELEEFVERIMTIQPDVNYRNENGDTALMMAAHVGNIKIFKMIYDSPDVEVNVRNKSRATALEVAATQKHLAIFDVILSGRRILSTNTLYDVLKRVLVPLRISQHSSSSIHVVRSTIHDSRFSWLEAYQAFTDWIYEATRLGDQEIVTCLLENIPGGPEREQDILRALKYEATRGNNTFFRILFSSMTFEPGLESLLLALATKSGMIRILENIVSERDIELDDVQVGGRPLLVIAVESSNLPMIEFLLKEGVDVNAGDRRGRTALSWAAYKYGCSDDVGLEIIEFLAQYENIDLHTTDVFGMGACDILVNTCKRILSKDSEADSRAITLLGGQEEEVFESIRARSLEERSRKMPAMDCWGSDIELGDYYVVPFGLVPRT